MKNKFTLLLVLLIGVLLLPNIVHAKTYNTLSFEEALADEELEKAYESYKPRKDAITIYLFRGKGCGYCRAYLEFMNSITEEYGKYFNMVTYEVWNDADNASLMEEVSNYLDEPAGGVPYVIIGEEVFPGYASQYDQGIKDAIISLYNTKEKDRYDVMTEMKKHPKKTTTESSADVWQFVLTIIFIVIATIALMNYTNIKFKELNARLDKVVKELTPKETTTKKAPTKEKTAKKATKTKK